MTVTSRRAILSVVLPLLAGACGPGDPPPIPTAGAEVFVRAPDGLLERPELQEVVEAQQARDVPTLRDALTSEDAAVRARAAFALGSIRSVGSSPDLAALLTDPDPRVRADAAFALGQISQAGGTGETMAGRLEVEADRRVRDELIDALGREGRPPGVQLLMRLDGEDRPAATRALARAFVRNSRPLGTVDTLVARLTDDDPVVRQYAAWALGRVQDITSWVDRRIEMRNALASMSRDDPAAMHLVQALGRRPDVFSFPRILERFRTSTDWRVRSNAVAAMPTMGIGDDQTRTVLLGLEDPSPLVRLQAALVIEGGTPLPIWMEAAEAAVASGEAELALVGPLLTYLARTARGEPVLAWVGALELDDFEGWRAAEAALREVTGQGAVDELRRAVASPDPRVSELGAGGLRRRWELSRAFPETHGYFFAALEQALGDALRAGSPGAVTEVVEAFTHPDLIERGSLERIAARVTDLPSGELRAAVAEGLRDAADPDAVSLFATLGPPVAAAPDEVAPVPPMDWSFLRELGTRPRLVLDTDEGRIVAVLDTESAPLTVQTLARVANEGRFDGVPFHRVIPNFVAQGGDLGLAGDDAAPLGHAMRSELTRIRFVPGERGTERILGMARTSEYDSESTQFFITHSMQPHLDGDYGAFGRVVEGRDVVDRILPLDLIRRARVVPGSLLAGGAPE